MKCTFHLVYGACADNSYDIVSVTDEYVCGSDCSVFHLYRQALQCKRKSVSEQVQKKSVIREKVE